MRPVQDIQQEDNYEDSQNSRDKEKTLPPAPPTTLMRIIKDLPAGIEICHTKIPERFFLVIGTHYIAEYNGMRYTFAGCWKRTSGVLFFALLLRLFFALACPHVAGDSPIYEAFARNLLEFGAYSHVDPVDHTAPEPTLIRVPGYPLILAAVFGLFGKGNERAVRIVQALLDTFTCLLIALIAFEIAAGDNGRRRRIAWRALLLSALCPFSANYSASILTEVPTTLLWTTATLFGVRALKDPAVGKNWFYCGLLAGGATLFRPESGILIAIFGIVLLLKNGLRRAWRPVISGSALMGTGLLLMLLPWAARNALTLRTIQFLATTYAQDPDERVSLGYLNWCRTWLWTYGDVYSYIFPMDSETLPTGPLPSGSFQSDQQQQTILQLIQRHNQNGNQLDSSSDDVFQSIARERQHKHPLRSYIGIPFLRSATMWFSPRTEILNLDGKLWPIGDAWHSDPVDFLLTLFLFAINICYMGLAFFGAISILKRSHSLDNFESLGCFALLAIMVLRTGFLAFFAFPEPRYILEAYPAAIVLGAFVFRMQVAGRRIPDASAQLPQRRPSGACTSS
jgi:4-amino-4-deoxy-L-arabinose transferase-like glycosyltransferase